MTRTPAGSISVGEPAVWFASYDPGAGRFPSALCTVISPLGFALSLRWFDSLEQREQRYARIVTEQPDPNAVHALLHDTEVVVVGVNIEDTQANALTHLAEFDLPYLSLFNTVSALAGRFRGISAPTIPSTVLLDT